MVKYQKRGNYWETISDKIKSELPNIEQSLQQEAEKDARSQFYAKMPDINEVLHKFERKLKNNPTAYGFDFIDFVGEANAIRDKANISNDEAYKLINEAFKRYYIPMFLQTYRELLERMFQ